MTKTRAEPSLVLVKGKGSERWRIEVRSLRALRQTLGNDVTSAFLGAGAEQDVLYDPKCQGGKPLVYVAFKPKVSGEMNALRRLVGKKRYAWVVIEGVMRGPEPVKVDPKLPDWLKDRFENSSQRYGHLDSLEMMIEVDRVFQVRDVDDGMAPAGEKPEK
jgi:hypothetical protein